MRTAAILLLGFAIAATAGARAALPTPSRTIRSCEERIDVTWPYLGNRRSEHQYRIVLGAVAVPPAYMRQVARTHNAPWTYWRKQGIVVRGNGASVTIVVPRAWRTRVGIAWGNGRYGVFSSLGIAGCRSDPDTGNAYAGGFYLRQRSACVPLAFRVGPVTTTVRFGIGRRCRPAPRA